MNASCDTTRPILRLITLIATVVCFAVLWSGDQQIQAEIAATRAKSRPVYAGPSVMQHLPVSPQNRASDQVAHQPPAAVLGFLDRIPGGHYQLTDEQGNIGTLVLHSQRGTVPVQQSLTIQSTFGQLQLTPMQTVSTLEMLRR